MKKGVPEDEWISVTPLRFIGLRLNHLQCFFMGGHFFFREGVLTNAIFKWKNKNIEWINTLYTTEMAP